MCAQYIAVSRSAFCYHYLPGLLYGELLLAIMLDALAESIATRFKFTMHVTVIVASALGLAYWAPWVYALELTRQGTVGYLIFGSIENYYVFSDPKHAREGLAQSRACHIG